jgi:hypothetical protein
LNNNRYVSQVCCCYTVRKIRQLELFPLLFTMIQTAADPNAFSNLQRIELRDTFLGAAAVTLLADVRVAVVVAVSRQSGPLNKSACWLPLARPSHLGGVEASCC